MQPDYPQPFVTVDVVLLSLIEGSLKTALVKRDREPKAGVWTLPGGWVHPDEDADAEATAVRILKVKAGLKSPYLEQLHTFSGALRDSRGWSVSIVYYALVRAAQVEPLTDAVQWVSVDTVKELPFDHKEMLKLAVSRVRSKALYSSLPVHLMPKAFSLAELQQVYELVLGRSLDKRTFRRRIEELDVVEPIEGAFGGLAHRPAQQYRVRRSKKLALTDSNLLKTHKGESP